MPALFEDSAMPHRKTVTVYTVLHREWEYNDEFYDPPHWEDDIDPERGPTGAGVLSVKSFLNRERAEAHCRELERKERKQLNPFQYGGDGLNLTDFTSLDPGQFLELLNTLEIEPPEMDDQGHGSLWQWWEEVVNGLDGDQFHAVWDALDHIRFFTVIPKLVELQT
jgi:hypothetical protein